MLGLTALILPLAPTWAQNQKADTPKPDGDRDTATADVKPDGDIHANKARQQLKGEAGSLRSLRKQLAKQAR